MEQMNLKVYLATINMHVKEFSELVGVHRCYLSSIVSGRNVAGPKLRKAIEDITDGQVKMKLKK
jgi:DNA-binding transcriptional regulator YdaS (Cro superfamily)